MIKWIKNKIKYLHETWEEADSLDSINISRTAERVPEGIRFLDLVSLYLGENGYYSRISNPGRYRLLVYRNWFRYIVGSPSFVLEVSMPKVWRYGNPDAIYSRPYGFEAPITGQVQSRNNPLLVCNVSDPDCLERILNSVDDFFRIK